MSINALHIRGIFLRNMFLLRRSWGRLVNLFFWVTIDLLVWGFFTVWARTSMLGKESSLDLVFLLVGALIFWDIFFKIQQAFSVSFLEEVWTRNTTNVFISPVTPVEFITGLVLFSFLQIVIVIGYSSALAFVMYKLTLWTLGFSMIPFILTMLLFGWALGLVVIGLLMRFGPSIETLAWVLPFLFQPISAVFYPVSALPAFLQKIAAMFPLSYVFEGMRSVLQNHSLSVQSMFVSIGLALMYLILAMMFFLWMLRIARKRGYLGRFTADS